ncbi:hypothetical protein [Streptomyces solincola]|uniref:hypothetical protein n=1 Tax=Streptomyces solincola TaxID=2100817 RepID=UPI0038997F6B
MLVTTGVLRRSSTESISCPSLPFRGSVGKGEHHAAAVTPTGKTDPIRRAQAAGRVCAGDPFDLTMLVIAMSGAWSPDSAVCAAGADEVEAVHERRRDRRRARVRRAGRAPSGARTCREGREVWSSRPRTAVVSAAGQIPAAAARSRFRAASTSAARSRAPASSAAAATGTTTSR